MSDIRSMYTSARTGEFPDHVEILGVFFEKVNDLRYGTNPHQPAAYYRPRSSAALALGHCRILKEGKNGLSQTNLEDMNGALTILKYADSPAAAVMKHVNPSGVAEARGQSDLRSVYVRARDCDPQAAFGAVVGFNRPVDPATAEEIMSTVVECVVAPGYENGSLEIFEDARRFGRNRDIRIVETPGLERLPRFVDDDTSGHLDIKMLGDGTVVLAAPFLTAIRSEADLKLASAVYRQQGSIRVERAPTEQEARDLIFAWHTAFGVRSNAVVVVKNGATLAVGTGQQDRVGAVEQAIDKYQRKYRGEERIEGAVLASDGYIPFRDSVDLAARVGISAIVQPGGSLRDAECIAACNEHGIAMTFTGERCFSHH
ncbi:MAG: IMP cyclohydrolase [candidate division Zixibacteria bacterium]|nr:IMP cyclohydrolase [candidate division Zixibacteria bacterium]